MVKDILRIEGTQALAQRL